MGRLGGDYGRDFVALPRPCLASPLPQPPPATGGGIHSTLAGESVRVSEPVGGDEGYVVFFRRYPRFTVLSHPPNNRNVG